MYTTAGASVICLRERSKRPNPKRFSPDAGCRTPMARAPARPGRACPAGRASVLPFACREVLEVDLRRALGSCRRGVVTAPTTSDSPSSSVERSGRCAGARRAKRRESSQSPTPPGAFLNAISNSLRAVVGTIGRSLLDARAALITGGSSGIGLAIARALGAGRIRDHALRAPPGQARGRGQGARGRGHRRPGRGGERGRRGRHQGRRGGPPRALRPPRRAREQRRHRHRRRRWPTPRPRSSTSSST